MSRADDPWAVRDLSGLTPGRKRQALIGELMALGFTLDDPDRRSMAELFGMRDAAIRKFNDEVLARRRK